MTVFAGIGCRRETPAEDLLAVIRDACGRAGQNADVLAAPAFKSAEPGLAQAAAQLGLPLQWIAQADLAAVQARCVTFSAAAERATGLPSIAEACALAAAGPAATLILPRIAHARATCALAECA